MSWLKPSQRKMTDYEKYDTLSAADRMGNRDVYNEQQVGRTKMGHLQSPMSRHVFAVTLSVLLTFIAWFFASLIQGINDGMLFASDWTNPATIGLDYYMSDVSFGKVVGVLSVGILIFVLLDTIFMKNLEAQNAPFTTDDINQYPNDQHIAFPEELQRKFDYFPDVGATSDVQFSSMISHVALSNKGLKKIQVAKRATGDIVDEDGEIVLYKGEVLRDEHGNIDYEEKPLLDKKFMEELYDASGLPKNSKDAEFRVYYDTRNIPYNPENKDREKLQNKQKPYNTVADLINADWQFPYYEPQRPGGAYLVDTAPVNTMVLAITRAGKGQTYIEKI